MTTSPQPVRDLWSLNPDVTFLNHGSFGACPTEVLQTQRELRDQMERDPVCFLAREILDRLDTARGTLAEFVGADPSHLAFVPNATAGVNTVLRSLKLDAGDEILVTDHGYNACNNAARFVAERSGAQVVVASIPFPIATEQEVIDAIVEQITPRTRLAVLDHITSPTALVLPIEKLVDALKARGVDTLVDGAHAPGMLPLEIEKIAPAYYTGNCHKWLCAPKGAAFLWVREDRIDGIRPLAISHGANVAGGTRSFFHMEADWTGTHDPTACLSIPAAIEFGRKQLGGAGWPAIRSTNFALARQGRDILCKALKIQDAPAPDTMLGSMAAIPLQALDPEAKVESPLHLDPLHVELFEQHKIEVPVWSWRREPHSRIVRVSAQLYNTASDYEALADALR